MARRVPARFTVGEEGDRRMTTQRVTWDNSVLERALTKLVALRDAIEADDQRTAAGAFATDELAVMATIDTLRLVLHGHPDDLT